MVNRTLLTTLLVCVSWSCGSKTTNPGSGNPVTPTPVPTVVSTMVTMVPATTVFIGHTAQLEARETLSDGTTRVASAPTWTSEANAVATVTSTGMLAAIAAGQTTISAGVGSNPRGTLTIRVYPQFAGQWSGVESVVGCTDSLDFSGLCASAFPLNELFRHDSSATQSEASVTLTLDVGGDLAMTSTGTISLDGLLTLPTASDRDPDLIVEMRNWSARADAPMRMSGTYDLWFESPNVQGGVLVSLYLADVRRVSSQTSARSPGLSNRRSFNTRIRQFVAGRAK